MSKKKGNKKEDKEMADLDIKENKAFKPKSDKRNKEGNELAKPIVMPP